MNALHCCLLNGGCMGALTLLLEGVPAELQVGSGIPVFLFKEMGHERGLYLSVCRILTSSYLSV